MTDLKRKDIFIQTMSLSLEFSGYASKESFFKQSIVLLLTHFTMGDVTNLSAI